jgi:serine palmitoyltransferase
MCYSAQGPKPKVLSSGKTLLNLASSNYLGYITNEDIKVNWRII